MFIIIWQVVIAIELENNLKFIYDNESQKIGKLTNIAKVNFSAFSINLDFAFRAEGDETAHVVASLVMNPMDAKAFLEYFKESLKMFEKKFGKIKRPDKRQKQKKSWFKRNR